MLIVFGIIDKLLEKFLQYLLINVKEAYQIDFDFNKNTLKRLRLFKSNALVNNTRFEDND